jgi:erythritol kinase (D-erythritol 1-phosphate-forming)
MTRDVIVGIDAGTSVLKAVAFTLDGRQLDSFAIPNSYQTLANGGVEQDMNRTWSDCTACLRGLAGKVPDLASRTAILAVTGQGDGTWLIDKDGESVAPGWLWLDARAGGWVEVYRASPAGRRHFELTGCGLNACSQGPHLAWMKAHTPELLERTATSFHCKDWLYFKLTGVRCTDPSEALFTFGDYRKRGYSEEAIENLGLARYRSLIAPIIDATVQQHALSAAAAAQTGLLAGTPVALGFVDVVCTALGGGLYDPSTACGCTIIGSTGMHIRFAGGADDVSLNAQSTGYTMAFPVPGQYAQMQSNMASTLNIDWLLDQAICVLDAAGIQRTRKDMLDGLDDRVADAGPAELLYHPFISEAGERGPFVDPSARASFIGLSSRHTDADLMRAIFEGLAYASRDCYAAMGPIPRDVRLTGGAARSAMLRKITAAVLGASVRTSSRVEAGAAGAAMIAAVGAGHYKTMADCVREWVTPNLGPLEAPDAELAAVYDATFPAYVASREALAPIWRQLARRKAVSV